MAMKKQNTPSMLERVHPLIIRLTHWTNFIALGLMITSGLRIYSASPIFGETELPTLFQFGGLAYARQWHFFAMWVFFINGAVWILYNLLTKHGRRTTLFSKKDVHGVLPMIFYYLRIGKEHPPTRKYNSLQKLAYTSTAILGLLGILSGIAIYWPVQFHWITWMFGGYDAARIFHFIFMASFLFFLFGHLVMVTIAGWGNFISIFTGKMKVPAHGPVQTETNT
jgi:thiosulfate reductase cytochrome b subunit